MYSQKIDALKPIHLEVLKRTRQIKCIRNIIENFFQNLQHAMTFRVQTMSDDRNVKGIMIILL